MTYTQSVGFLWTRDGRDLYLTTHDPCGIRTRNPSKQAAADPRLRPRGQRDRLRGKHEQKYVR